MIKYYLVDKILYVVAYSVVINDLDRRGGVEWF